MSESGARLARRFAAVLLLLVPLLPVWSLLVAPLLDDWAEARSRHRQLAEVAFRSERTIGQRVRLEAELQAVEAEAANAPGMIRAATAAQALAELQQAVKRVLDGGGARLRSLQGVPDEEAAEAASVGLRVEALLPAEQLPAVLRALESVQSPRLRIRALELRAPDSGGGGGQDDARRELTLRLEVASRFLGPER